MTPLAIFIVLELVLSASILGLSSQHKISNVLGIKIAQVDEAPATSETPPADNSPATADNPPVETPSQPANPAATEPTATDQSTPQPSQPPNGTAAPADQSNQSNQTNQDSTTQLDNKPLFEPDLNPSPSGQDQATSSNTQSIEEATPKTEAGNEIQTAAVLNPDDLINSPENINSQSISEAKKEDDQLNQVTDPKEQTNLLITFATDKVKDMINFSQSDDFSSANFATQRFNEQIDHAISNLEKLAPKDQIKAKKQLVNFCNQADPVLRTVELSVPEESEQDILIARGQCQELQL